MNSIEKHIVKLAKSQRYLLAVSGGVDSMVLAHACHTAGLNIAVAHVNFQLRGSDADQDQNLVKTWCEKREIPFYTTAFDTKLYCKTNHLSIQEGARELRYNWFAELAEKHPFDKVLTAHHLNDNVETFFINFLRGAGISGLKGIPQDKGLFFRPLLDVPSSEIRAYAAFHQVPFREDVSNASDAYLRNRLRHYVIPPLEEFEGFYSRATENFKLLVTQEKFYREAVSREVENYFISKNPVEVDLDALKRSPFFELLAYEIFRPWGFSATQIADMLKAKTGALFYVSSHKAAITARGTVIVVPLEEVNFQQEFLIEPHTDMSSPIRLSISTCRSLPRTFTPKEAYIAADKLKFPLTLRKYQEGDSFVPFGMKGRKKLSDFFTDEKTDRFTRENSWVLLSENEIVWLVGHRVDNRYRVDKESTHILKLSTE